MIKKSRQSTVAIERLYISMRHLFNRGSYSPTNTSGIALRDMLLTLQPEIYGDLADTDKVELNGLIYVTDRLPQGIEECRFINLTADEGYKKSHFVPIIPAKRRRNCYRIDSDQINIEITRGRSEIYDILTHLTFLFNEAQKIMHRAYYNDSGEASRAWKKIEEIVLKDLALTRKEREVALVHLAGILGRTFDETLSIDKQMHGTNINNRLFKLIYWMGRLSMDEYRNDKRREITFSAKLRNNIGNHFHGEKWALKIKKTLHDNELIDKPLHIISANMHSVMNILYVKNIDDARLNTVESIDTYKILSQDSHKDLRSSIFSFAQDNGMIYIQDQSGSNINAQIFDLRKVALDKLPWIDKPTTSDAVLIVMDYAFGEQAFEAMDELLKPYKIKKTGKDVYLDVRSISIMGKAGVLEGKKGDIMIPTAHVLEGSADNYPFENQLSADLFKGSRLGVYQGPMVSVMGTSLQSKDILTYFKNSSWGAIGLEMEGAHYQKAIQSASKIRKHISPDVILRYAYYASDNPLKTGSTLASGALGLTGVKPTYLITEKILSQIIND